MKKLLYIMICFFAFKSHYGTASVVKHMAQPLKKSEKADGTDGPVGNCSGCNHC